MFSKFTTEGLTNNADYVAGTTYTVPSGVYKGVIKLAYATQSTGGALGVSFVVMLDETGKELKQTIWITDKKGNNYYTTQKGQKTINKGYNLVDEMCWITTDKPLNKQTTDEKLIKLYDAAERQEKPKQVQVLTALVDKRITLAILEVLSNKQVKRDDGEWVAIEDTRKHNEIVKALFDDMRTLAEKSHGASSAYVDAWLSLNEGVIKDERTIIEPVAAPVLNASSTATVTPISLFK